MPYQPVSCPLSVRWGFDFIGKIILRIEGDDWYWVVAIDERIYCELVHLFLVKEFADVVVL